MRAAYYQEPGGPENLEVGERPDPEPGPGEVLIRNRAAGVGIWDVKIMASASANRSFPAIPGFENRIVLARESNPEHFSRDGVVFDNQNGGRLHARGPPAR